MEDDRVLEADLLIDKEGLDVGTLVTTELDHLGRSARSEATSRRALVMSEGGIGEERSERREEFFLNSRVDIARAVKGLLE